MKPTISCLHMDLTEAISKHVYKKTSSLEKFIKKSDESVTCTVELAKTTNHHHKGDIFKTEINLHTAGKTHRVENTQSDLYAAVDKACDMMKHELKTHYGKKQAVWKRGATQIKKMLRKSE